MDEVIFEEFKGTGNMELVLDRGLAEIEEKGKRNEQDGQPDLQDQMDKVLPDRLFSFLCHRNPSL